MDNIYQKINNFLNIVIKNVFHQICYIKNTLGKKLNKIHNKWYLFNIILGRK